MFDFAAHEWIIIVVGSMLIGINKTGIPGVLMIFVPILASILPAKESTGFLLPLLLVADLFAITYYKRHTQWKLLFRLIPFSLLGIIGGYFTMRALENAQIKPIIGIIVLVMLAVQAFRMLRKNDEAIPQGIWFALVMGIVAGYTTMVANAAGPAIAIFLLAMRLPKEQFVGTGAWYYFIVNVTKVPLSASLGLITAQSLLTGAVLIPAIALGAFIGIKLLPLIPQKVFQAVILVIAAAGALRLLF